MGCGGVVCAVGVGCRLVVGGWGCVGVVLHRSGVVVLQSSGVVVGVLGVVGVGV